MRATLREGCGQRVKYLTEKFRGRANHTRLSAFCDSTTTSGSTLSQASGPRFHFPPPWFPNTSSFYTKTYVRDKAYLLRIARSHITGAVNINHVLSGQHLIILKLIIELMAYLTSWPFFLLFLLLCPLSNLGISPLSGT